MNWRVHGARLTTKTAEIRKTTKVLVVLMIFVVFGM